MGTTLTNDGYLESEIEVNITQATSEMIRLYIYIYVYTKDFPKDCFAKYFYIGPTIQHICIYYFENISDLI